MLGPTIDDDDLDGHRRAARRHAVEDAGRARWVRRRPAALHRPAREPGPLLHLHHRVDARRHRRRAGRAAGAALARGRRRCVARLRANVDRLRPGHPSPIVPFVCGSEPRARGGRRRSPSAGCSSPPSGRRRCRRARRACGWRCRPPTPTSRSTGWRPPSPSCSQDGRDAVVTGADAGVRERHRHRGGQDLVAAATARELRAARRARSPPASPRSRASRGRPPTPRSSPPPPARTPTRVPAAPHLPPGVGAADGRRELGAPGFTTADLTGELGWPAGGRRRPGGGRRRSALAGERRRRQRRPRHRARTRPVVVVADAGLGTINAVRLSVDGLRRLPRDRRAQPLHRRSPPPSATASTSSSRRRLRRGDRAARPRRPAPPTVVTVHRDRIAASPSWR